MSEITGRALCPGCRMHGAGRREKTRSGNTEHAVGNSQSANTGSGHTPWQQEHTSWCVLVISGGMVMIDDDSDDQAPDPNVKGNRIGRGCSFLLTSCGLWLLSRHVEGRRHVDCLRMCSSFGLCQAWRFRIPFTPKCRKCTIV